MLSATPINPGQTGTIEITLVTLGLTDINKTISLFTNDPDNHKVVLTLKGTIEPEFALSRQSLYFNSSATTMRTASQSIDITLAPTKQLKLLGATSSDDAVRVALKPIHTNHFRLVAWQRSDATPGYHFGIITVATTSSHRPTLIIPVRGIVAPSFATSK